MRYAEISLSSVRHNVRRILEVSGGANLIAVVKADGYGHGAAMVADAALEAGASIIGVTDLTEAFNLRKDGIDAPILSWLHGPGVDFERALNEDIQLGLSRVDQLAEVAQAAKNSGRLATVHLKLDTGLSRGGLSESSWIEAFSIARGLQNDGLIQVVGIFSHLSNAGEDEDRKQASKFDRAIALAASLGIKPEYIHLASSAATFSSPNLHYNTVRVGLSIYGMSPFEGVPAAELGLQPVMTLKAQIISRRLIERDIGVSYSFIYRSPGDTQLALIPMGYADGLPRLFNEHGAEVVVRGVTCQIVGRIAMDQCVIDLTPLGDDAENVKVGDIVTLFGDPKTGVPSIDDWADRMHTINYEIAARLGQRILNVPVE